MSDGGACHRPRKILLKLEVARQERRAGLCASVRAVPWADEAEQQLSRLALSGCELCVDVPILGAGLRKEPGSDLPYSQATFEV